MASSATVYLPLSTTVYVQVTTNAAFTQKVTITPEGRSPIVYEGSGEGEHPIGNTTIQTPGSSSNPRGYPVTVEVESDNGSGQWQPSTVMQGSCGIMYYNLVMVVSEDYIDQDWNDSVSKFSWWVEPSQR